MVIKGVDIVSNRDIVSTLFFFPFSFVIGYE